MLLMPPVLRALDLDLFAIACRRSDGMRYDILVHGKKVLGLAGLQNNTHILSYFVPLPPVERTQRKDPLLANARLRQHSPLARTSTDNVNSTCDMSHWQTLSHSASSS